LTSLWPQRLNISAAINSKLEATIDLKPPVGKYNGLNTAVVYCNKLLDVDDYVST